MEYNPELHCMECPKCGHGMDAISCADDLLIDRCTHCQGLWFDQVEAELPKSKWMTEALEIGRSGKSKRWDGHAPIACPHCGQPMERAADPDEPRIWYEVCQKHGMFMDAAKFTDLKQQTLSDWFISLVRSAR